MVGFSLGWLVLGGGDSFGFMFCLRDGLVLLLLMYMHDSCSFACRFAVFVDCDLV